MLEDVHPQASVATRCFFVDRTDLMKPVNGFYAKIPAGRPKLLNATVAVENPGEHVTYFGAAKYSSRLPDFRVWRSFI